MNTSNEKAMRLALEALEHGLDYAKSEQFENAQRYKGYERLAPDDAHSIQLIETAIASLRQAIAEAEKQEPVAWSVTRYGIHCNNVFSNKTLAEIELKRLDEKYGKEGRTLAPLYTTPYVPTGRQQRKPLTDEQIDKAMAENKQTLIDAADNYWKMRRAYARIIEAAHGIKE